MILYSFVEFNHIFGGFEDLFSQGLGRQDLYLVAVAENPPGNFAQPVDAEFHRCRAIGITSYPLCAVPEYLGDIVGDLGQEAQRYIVKPAFGYHHPGLAEVIIQVEVPAVQIALVQQLQTFDAVELEGANAFVKAGVAQDIPGPVVVHQVVRAESQVDDAVFEKRVIADMDFAFIGDSFLQFSEGFIEQAGRRLGGGLGGDIPEGGIAVMPDFGRQVVFYFQGGPGRGFFERLLYLAGSFVYQQQQAQCFLQAEVYRRQEELGVEAVPGGLGVIF